MSRSEEQMSMQGLAAETVDPELANGERLVRMCQVAIAEWESTPALRLSAEGTGRDLPEYLQARVRLELSTGGDSAPSDALMERAVIKALRLRRCEP